MPQHSVFIKLIFFLNYPRICKQILHQAVERVRLCLLFYAQKAMQDTLNRKNGNSIRKKKNKNEIDLFSFLYIVTS